MADAARHNATATILFVVAHPNCEEFEIDFGWDDWESTMTPAANDSTCEEDAHNFMRLEQKRWQDLIEIPMKDAYKKLPEKMAQAYHWVLNNIPNTKWVGKADDDAYVRVKNLERYLHKHNPEIPMVIGEIVHESIVQQDGKWAEPDYQYEFYPDWPRGSSGYVLSRPAVQCIVENSELLHRYQGEDTNVGIWLDEAQQNGHLKDIAYVGSSFGYEGFSLCKNSSFLIIGHNLSP
uniref:Hexosyltransferase n=1 Tax=Pseudo-nitzschia australis TaxID=44445 RepID=A0A7S4A8N3_9STRA|mmetsp:Transcript_9054/g.19553  ORF Transcript_9054/g.19553 Transcript_9054/m.19553 type:complete len:235 (-) Transcript_9054:303-1007(-)